MFANIEKLSGAHNLPFEMKPTALFNSAVLLVSNHQYVHGRSPIIRNYKFVKPLSNTFAILTRSVVV